MKTLTEFAVPTLKNAFQKKQELTAAGKTAEELPAAMGESLKLEGDKLTYLLAALDVVGEKTNDLKRVIVSALNEGEKAPSGAKLIGEKYFTVEYYPSLHKGGPRKPEEGRGDKRGGKRDGKRGGKPGDRRGGRGGGEGRSAGGRGPGSDNAGGGGAGGGRGRGPRGPKPAEGGPVSLPKPLVKPVSSVESAEKKES
jgi:hypothetical protein